MDYFGIDIGHGTTRVVHLKKVDKAGVELLAIGETKTPAANWRQAGQKGIDSMASAVKLLISDLKIGTRQCVASLPEEEVISRLVKLPPLKDNEIQDALLFEAETFIPYPLEEASLNYEVISRDEQGRPFVFVVAVRHEVVEQYVKLFKACGLSPIAFETTSLGMRNAFSQIVDQANPVLVLNLGEIYTDLVIIRENSVYSTRALSVGGEAFTKAISLNLGLDIPSAEEYKKAYGMKEQELEGKIKLAILPVFNSIAEEVRKAMVSHSQEFGKSIESVYLSGGGANMPGFAENLTKMLGVEVQVAQPFAKIDSSKLQLPINLQASGCQYVLATGLALRELV